MNCERKQCHDKDTSDSDQEHEVRKHKKRMHAKINSAKKNNIFSIDKSSQFFKSSPVSINSDDEIDEKHRSFFEKGGYGCDYNFAQQSSKMTAKDCDDKRDKKGSLNHLQCVVNGKISDLKEK